MTVTLTRPRIPTQTSAQIAEQVARQILTARDPEPRAACGCLIAALELTQGECSHNNWLTPVTPVVPSDPSGWACDASAAEFVLALVDVFNAAGFGWRVSALGPRGQRTFTAARNDVRVSSDGVGVRVSRVVGGRVVRRRRLRRGVPVTLALAVAEGLATG